MMTMNALCIVTEIITIKEGLAGFSNNGTTNGQNSKYSYRLLSPLILNLFDLC